MLRRATAPPTQQVPLQGPIQKAATSRMILGEQRMHHVSLTLLAPVPCRNENENEMGLADDAQLVLIRPSSL